MVRAEARRNTRDLYRFGLLECVIPYVLLALSIEFADRLQMSNGWRWVNSLYKSNGSEVTMRGMMR
jgi:hypothetical protein